MAAALVWAPPALPHESLSGFTSTVTGVSPKVAGVSILVLEGDDEVQLTNTSGKDVVVLGYQREPYLRFAADGLVYMNRRSPAAFLNQDRFAETKVPKSASPSAPPRWSQVGTEGSYRWHDHRIHWMSPIPPPVVATAEDEPHHVFDWRVPASVGGTAFAIEGSLDYAPTDEGLSSTEIVGIGIAGAVLVAAAAGGIVLVRRRRSD